MSELGPEARALLEQTRDGDDPSERDRARMRQRLAIAMAAAATGAAASAAAPAAAATTSATATATATVTHAGIGAQVAAGAQVVAAGGVTAKIGVAVTVAAISVAGGGAVLKHELAPPANAREPAAEVARQPRARKVPLPVREIQAPIAEAPIREPSAETAVEPPAIEAPQEAVIANSAPGPSFKRAAVLRPKPKPTSPEPESLPASLQTELKLLSLAQSALRDGAHDRVLALLAEHAARFPHGTLALERDAVRAITLCSSGRVASGRSAAGALAPRIAGSPLAARLERACELEAIDDDEEKEP